ncbi:hypothetical protein [Actinoplanes sp. NPDC026619]|uniref:hypothetical protein n=1 Tax=Actinoplanes sp. NPDC026619 TaxID=3155798 RepID=UPI0033F1407A
MWADGQFERWQQRMSAPENEFPGSAGISALLGRTADAAVGIGEFAGFSTGFRFTLAVRLRRPRPEFARGGLFGLLSAHVHPGVAIPPASRLLLGLEYADGRRADTLRDRRAEGPGSAPDDEQLLFTQQSGGGGDTSVDQTYWVSPLPPAGPVTFVLSWPSFGMAEIRTEVDGTAIRAAAGRSEQLWPPQPPDEPTPPPPAPRPTTGWFSYPEEPPKEGPAEG